MACLVERDNCPADTCGSHRQCKHATKAGRVTIAGQLNKDLHPKTYRSILTQAQLEDQ